MSEFPYDVLMDSLKEYNDILCRLYRLKTSRKGDIDAFFKEIDKQISKYLEYSSKYDFLVTITNAAKGNNGYIKSYLTLMGKILQKYHPNDLYETSFGQYILEKYFGIKSTESNQSKIGDLLKSLIYDDVKLLVSYTELSEFSHIDSINFTDFPCVKSHLTLLETCCYYGSVNCFKFLRTKFSAEITELCLQLSFLGGNPDIVSECLKYHEPNKKCMKYAIMSHNIDFVTFLMNEYKIPIDVDYCIKYDNIQAFLIHYDQTNDLKGFIVNTCYFPFVWKTIFIYSIFQTIDKKYQELLYTAKSIALYRYESSCEGDFNFKDDSGKTILHYAAIYFHDDIDIDFLFYNGTTIINEQDIEGKTALHYAAINGKKNFATHLHDGHADFDISDNEGKIPLHYAVISGDVETASTIIKYTKNIRKRDNNSKFPLHYAINHKKMFKSLVCVSRKHTQYYRPEDALELEAFAKPSIQSLIDYLKSEEWKELQRLSQEYVLLDRIFR